MSSNPQYVPVKIFVLSFTSAINSIITKNVFNWKLKCNFFQTINLTIILLENKCKITKMCSNAPLRSMWLKILLTKDLNFGGPGSPYSGLNFRAKSQPQILSGWGMTRIGTQAYVFLHSVFGVSKSPLIFFTKMRESSAKMI